ncbi:MAG: hypothetical protein AB7F28_06270 [Candidatus Margulisiibacteriota bacterium]
MSEYRALLVAYGLPDIVFFLLLPVGIYFFYRWLVLRKPHLKAGFLTFVLCLHVVFGLFYAYLSANGMTADATLYFKDAFVLDHWTIPKRLGTRAVVAVTYPFIHFFGLGYFSVTTIFGLLGFIGLFCLYLKIHEKLQYPAQHRILNGIFLLPGFHFWSCALGKDSLIQLGIGLFLSRADHPLKKILTFGLGGFVVLAMRPHIFGLLLLGYAFGLVFSESSIFSFKKMVLLILIGLTIASSTVMILRYVGLPNLSNLDQLNAYIDIRSGHNPSNSKVDLSHASFPEKIFAFSFRPLFFDAKNALMLIVSFENLILLWLCRDLFNLRFWAYIIKTREFYPKLFFFYWLFGSAMLGLTNFNLGISVRQKWMVLHILLFLILLYQNHQQQQKNT